MIRSLRLGWVLVIVSRSRIVDASVVAVLLLVLVVIGERLLHILNHQKGLIMRRWGYQRIGGTTGEKACWFTLTRIRIWHGL